MENDIVIYGYNRFIKLSDVVPVCFFIAIS